MTTELEQLVRDTIDLTGAAPPSVLDDRGPTLADAALAASGFYLIGLIGGKEVGKSSLVNALVGAAISKATSFGPGTEMVIAYAHESQAIALKELLEKHVPKQYRIITHRIASLARQVLLDLPDIDSHFESHLELTRKMLKHILYPLWMQSVEKYADRQPQQLLAAVAGGNSATNFLFCLNKADQLEHQGGTGAIEELRADFSARIAKTLSIDPPKVWMLSAARATEFDLPELRKLLSQEKSDGMVKQSQSAARQQQDRSILSWLDGQDLSGRADRLKRLEEEAAELLAARVGTPLLEKSLPALAEDPASRLALTDEVLGMRVSRWPMVNLVHLVLTPVLAVVRRNVGVTRSAALPDAEGLVDAHLRPGGVPVAVLIRNTFALLQQSNPRISELYAQRRLWEDMPADTAAVALRTRLTDTIDRQRQAVRKKLGGRGSILFAPLRWLLTMGAILWFPFIQPALDSLMIQNSLDWSIIHNASKLTQLVVHIFSVNELLQSLEFLLLYFFLLWVILRWHTQRRVARFAARWKEDSSDLSLTMQTIGWLDDLLAPVRGAKEQVERLEARRHAIETK
jgi:GTPase Era involved in 16S rRNA processing